MGKRGCIFVQSKIPISIHQFSVLLTFMKSRSYSIDQQSCWSEILTEMITVVGFVDDDCSTITQTITLTTTIGKPKTSAEALVINLIVPSGSKFNGTLPPSSATPSHSSLSHSSSANTTKIVIGVVVPVAAILAFIIGVLLIRCHRRRRLTKTIYLNQRHSSSTVAVGHNAEKIDVDREDSQQGDQATARPTEPQIFERRQQVKPPHFTQLTVSELPRSVTELSRQPPHTRYIPQPPTTYPGKS